MIILGINTALFIYMGNGPAWPFATGPDHNCEHYWWTNLLYINNFFGMKKQVLLHSKYCRTRTHHCTVLSVCGWQGFHLQEISIRKWDFATGGGGGDEPWRNHDSRTMTNHDKPWRNHDSEQGRTMTKPWQWNITNHDETSRHITNHDETSRDITNHDKTSRHITPWIDTHDWKHYLRVGGK